MAGITRFAYLAIAVAFHLVYILSIFDIYFVSPIVSGMQLFKVERKGANAQPPADRLVLFVGDGLRADKTFLSFPDPYPKTDEDLVPRPLAPYLRSRVLEHGTFGVSHTRVPTESRPGHVALIAGLYEDVSAVMTGWKHNPVNFDSVFNRSSHTWSWGSPDILPMFQDGAVPGRVDAHWYGHEFEDFSQDSTNLDYWVFDHVKELFAEAEHNEELNKALRQKEVVFFLHLLGLDTAGHSYRPYSKEYLHNLQVVDQGVKEIVDLIEGFYDDDRTAFVFTADHGMSDWGSHGDGHPDNTRTPLITWGSGIAKPIRTPGTIAPGHDEYSAEWGFDHIQRHDVNQADIAALMTYLIGADFPGNSVGELPLSYLSGSIKEKAEASLTNARGILEMYRVKEETKKTAELRYRPFQPLNGEGHLPEERLASIQILVDSGKYEEAIEESDSLMQLGLQGLRYLQTYDWLFLRALITVGYLGWMAFGLTTVIDLHVLQSTTPASRSFTSNVAFSSVLVTLYASFMTSNSPFAYYAYAFFPVMFWEEVYARRNSLVQGKKVLLGHIQSSATLVPFLLNMTLYIGVIVSLAVGYIHRELLTVLYLLGAFWPLTYGVKFVRKYAALSGLWVVSCVVMSTFTVLSAMKTESVYLIMGGGASMVMVGLLYLAFEDVILSGSSPKGSDKARQSPSLLTSRTVIGIQIGFVMLAMVVTRSSALSLQAKEGLPLGNQVVGWIVLVVPLFMPFAHRLQPNNHYMHRLLVMFLTCAPTFVLLAISYEGLFYVAFSITLVAWVGLEHRGYRERSAPKGLASRQLSRSATGTNAAKAVPGSRPLELADARVALFFFVLLQSAFFSTGNIASVTAFSLDSVYRLIPIFDPFAQGALLIVKLMIPFAVISANLGVLNKRLGVAPSALLMVSMVVSDILTLYFFWVVKDEGSWLEIGSTISHFVIASLLCVFVAALEGVSAFFTSGMEVAQDDVPQDIDKGADDGTSKQEVNGAGKDTTNEMASKRKSTAGSRR